MNQQQFPPIITTKHLIVQNKKNVGDSERESDWMGRPRLGAVGGDRAMEMVSGAHWMQFNRISI